MPLGPESGCRGGRSYGARNRGATPRIAHIKIADAVHVFDVGAFIEGVDARVWGQLLAREGGDARSTIASGGLQAVFAGLNTSCCQAGEGKFALFFPALRTFKCRATVERLMELVPEAEAPVAKGLSCTEGVGGMAVSRLLSLLPLESLSVCSSRT